jgi:prophage DNA circulation protein
MAVYDTSDRYILDESRQTASRVDTSVSRAITYTCRSFDRLETIAARQLGDESRYWEIADLNPQIKFPLDITIGTVLRLPV